MEIGRFLKRKRPRKILSFLTALSALLISLLFLSPEPLQKKAKIHSRDDSSRCMNRRDQPAGLFSILLHGRAGGHFFRLLSALSAASAFPDCQGRKQCTPDSSPNPNRPAICFFYPSCTAEILPSPFPEPWNLFLIIRSLPGIYLPIYKVKEILRVIEESLFW